MLLKLLDTRAGPEAFVLRLALAAIFFAHGSQKVFGWWGGHGLAGTYGAFVGMGIPGIFAVLAIAAEFLGSIGLALGLLTRVAAFGIGSVMAAAVFMVHWEQGFFMNWSGAKPAEGFEFHILAFGIALALAVAGAGPLSLDRLIAGRIKGGKHAG